MQNTYLEFVDFSLSRVGYHSNELVLKRFEDLYVLVGLHNEGYTSMGDVLTVFDIIRVLGLLPWPKFSLDFSPWCAPRWPKNRTLIHTNAIRNDNALDKIEYCFS